MSYEEQRFTRALRRSRQRAEARLSAPAESVETVVGAEPGAVLRPVEKSDSLVSLLVCGLLVLVSVGRIQELWGPLSSLRLGLVSTALACLTSFGKDFSELIRRLSTTRGKIVISIYVLCWLTIPTSVWPGRSFRFVTFDFAMGIVFFSLVLFHVRTLRGLLFLAFTLAVSSAALAFAGLAAGGDISRLSASTSYDPNDTAMVIVCGLPFVYLLGKRLKGPARWAALAVGGAMILAVASTESRGGAIGFAVVAAFLLFMDQTLSARKRVLVVAISLVVFWGLAPERAKERIWTVFSPETDYNMTSASGRITTWKHGLELMFTHPILGVGAGGFEAANGLYFGDEGSKYKAAHNSFIEVGAELGVIGLGLFLYLLGSTFFSMFRLVGNTSLPRDDLARSLPLAISASLIGYCVCGFFISQGFSPVAYLLVSMGIIVEDCVPAARQSLRKS